MTGAPVITVASALLAVLSATAPLDAQQSSDTLPVTAYAQAERFMQHKMGNKVYRDRVDIHWLADGYRFWYGTSTAAGTEYNLVHPVKNTKQLLVDRLQLAKGLSATMDSTIEANRLTLGDFELAKDGNSIQFNVGTKRFSCELAGYRCTSIAAKPAEDRAAKRSPDGKWDAFIRSHDLYVKRVPCEVADGDDCAVRLTTDGSVHQAYGRAGTFGSISAARTGTPQPPVLVWSPDSRKIAVMNGTSGGGFVTTAAMLRYPDFFKAGVAFAGNHDDRSEHIIVGESWRGLYRSDAASRDNYERDANYLLAGNLKGKLMLVHADLDEAVHPSMSIRMAAALIDAGKRFDFMILPDQGHTSGGWFGTRILFDYFVHNLMGLEPPQYTFTGTADPVTMRRRAPVKK